MALSNWGDIWGEIWGDIWADDGGGPPAESISITADDATISVGQNLSRDILVTLQRGGGYTGTVTLVTTGLPTGATASYLDGDTYTGSTTVRTIRVACAIDAPEVTDDAFVITASGTGVSDSTINGTLTITTYTAPSIPGGASLLKKLWWFFRRRR